MTLRRTTNSPSRNILTSGRYSISESLRRKVSDIRNLFERVVFLMRVDDEHGGGVVGTQQLLDYYAREVALASAGSGDGWRDACLRTRRRPSRRAPRRHPW